ncbi:perilipin-1 [Megalops cyprinoides]|uniref:perilipin-1 n=1 Tax=Megalops cyprinoides TaxID=118141 RepID=UPI001864986C|nr:perilipin-1 [Megalops cyprinoides]
MAPEKTAPPSVQDGSAKDSVFLRLLNLPVVSSTCEVIERTYTNTKHTHPILCSVCGVYERGARTAGSLAVWSVQPAIMRLEPQIEAVNSLACRGLDRLEEKIPALQYPPEKLALGIAEAVTSTVQSAREGITGTIASTSDMALSLASNSYQLTRSAVSDSVDYVLSSKPVRLAEEGADTALTLTEHLVNYILPASEEEIEKDTAWAEETEAEPPGPAPGYRRLGVLVSTVCRRAYDQTSTQLQRAADQGQRLVMSVPGVTPLTGVAVRNLKMVGGVALGLQSSVLGLFGQVEEVSDKESRKKKEGELLKSGGVRGLVSSLGQQLQSTYMSVVSGAKNAPGATLGLARDSTSALLETLDSARTRLVETVAHYGLFPGLSSNKGESEDASREETEVNEPRPTPSEGSGQDQKPAPQGPALDRESGPPQISDETRLLQRKVLEQIPVQQRILLSGSRPTLSAQRDGKGEVVMRSHSSGYTRTAHKTSYTPAKKQ